MGPEDDGAEKFGAAGITAPSNPPLKCNPQRTGDGTQCAPDAGDKVETGGAFANVYLPDVVTVDLMTSYQFNVWNDKWTVQLNAINIFNRKYLSEAELISGGPTPHTVWAQ